jgi:hypothetical protein
MYYKECQTKENKIIGPYHTNDNGEKFMQVYGGANGRKETNFVVDCKIILVWII